MLKRNKSLTSSASEAILSTKLLNQPDESGFLEPETEREKTAFMSQAKLKGLVPVQAANKMFELDLDLGPYSISYSRNGRFLLLGGQKGSFSSFDWQAGRLACDINLSIAGLKEKVHDVCYLQNETMLAVAQENYVYAYDGAGVELHRMNNHRQVRHMQYLPYHFLLSTVSSDAWIRWQDVSVGQLAAEWRVDNGVCLDACQNPATAVMHLGHASGVVSFWAPSLNKPLVRVKCHRGPVKAVAINATGTAMATAGLDGTCRVWDIRNTYKSLGEYRTMRPASAIAFSQRDLLAVSFDAHVSVWRGVTAPAQPKYPYMTHVTEGKTISSLAFCPYEDILGVGTDAGFTSLLIPGSGEPNYDSFEANPYANRSQRQEREVHALLDKLQPDTIGLDGGSNIGRVNRTPQAKLSAERADKDGAKEKKKAKGRSTSMKRYLRKRANVIDQYKADAAEKARTETIHRDLGHSAADNDGLTALNRFVNRSI